VTLVGKVLSVAERGTELEVQVTDGTGLITAFYYGDLNEDVSHGGWMRGWSGWSRMFT
jgi:hypothetical protein